MCFVLPPAAFLSLPMMQSFNIGLADFIPEGVPLHTSSPLNNVKVFVSFFLQLNTLRILHSKQCPLPCYRSKSFCFSTLVGMEPHE